MKVAIIHVLNGHTYRYYRVGNIYCINSNLHNNIIPKWHDSFFVCIGLRYYF